MALLKIRGLSKRFDANRPLALDHLDFDLQPGETLGIVGRSGSGKSTLAAIVARLMDADAGSIELDGENLCALPSRRAARAPWRTKIQLVFQDAKGSLDPLIPCGAAIAAPLWNDPVLSRHRAALRARIEQLATAVALPLSLLDRLPHQLSGGEAARVAIARALACAPSILILDEPTAALDVGVQASVMHTIDALRREQSMSMLFISHDQDLVRLLCDRVLTLERGRLV